MSSDERDPWAEFETYAQGHPWGAAAMAGTVSALIAGGLVGLLNDSVALGAGVGIALGVLIFTWFGNVVSRPWGTKRAELLRSFARSHSLSFAPRVASAFLDPSFFLFGEGRGELLGSGENLLEGSWSGTMIHEFDYSMKGVSVVPGADSVPTTYVAPYLQYSAAAFATPGLSWPQTIIYERDALARMTHQVRHALHHSSEGDSVETGHAEFDRRFIVSSADPSRLASIWNKTLLESLLRCEGLAWEFGGETVVVYCPLLEPERVPVLLDAASSLNEVLIERH